MSPTDVCNSGITTSCIIKEPMVEDTVITVDIHYVRCSMLEESVVWTVCGDSKSEKHED